MPGIWSMASISIIVGHWLNGDWSPCSPTSQLPHLSSSFFLETPNSATENRSSKAQITHEAQWNKKRTKDKQPLSFTSSSCWPSFSTPALFNSENHIIHEGKHIESHHLFVETTSFPSLYRALIYSWELHYDNIGFSGHNWAPFCKPSLFSLKSSWSVYRIF